MGKDRIAIFAAEILQKSKSVLYFSKFLVNSKFYRVTNTYIFKKSFETRILWYIVRTEIL